MNTTAPPDTTGGAHLTPFTLTSNDTFTLMPNVAQHSIGDIGPQLLAWVPAESVEQ
jgi:hypothetical protein